MHDQSLLLSYLNYLTNGFKNMNALSSYVRLFPMLLGGSTSRLVTTSSFVSKFSFLRATDDPSNSNRIFNKANLSGNPFYEKYAGKIEKLKQTNPKEYAERMASLEAMHVSQCQNDKSKENQAPVSKARTGSVDKTTFQGGDSKTLDSILNLEKIRNLSSDDIRTLWIEYYASKDAVCAVIPSATYRSIHEIATLFPLFVYPVPRQDGYEMFVGQFSDEEFHFTSLVNYQCHQENAVIQLSLKHYTELENDKGIILMSGIVTNDHGISVSDAHLISYLVQHFYMEHTNLIERFNHSPSTFNFEDIANAMDEALVMKAGKSSN